MSKRLSSPITPFLIYGSYISVPFLAVFAFVYVDGVRDLPVLILIGLVLLIGIVGERDLYDAFETPDAIEFRRKRKRVVVPFEQIRDVELDYITRGFPIRVRTDDCRIFLFYPKNLFSGLDAKRALMESIKAKADARRHLNGNATSTQRF